MSSSVFKIYPSSSASNHEENPLNEGEASTSLEAPVDEHLKIDSNLVIVVGKDGSVHVDQKTLHSLLANETTDTSVSLVRITSPTPSIEEEIEEERRLLEERKLEQELESVTGEESESSPESSNVALSTGTNKNDVPTLSAAAGSSGVSTRRSKTTVKKDDILLDDDEAPHVSLMVEGFYPPAEAKKFAAEVLTLAGLQKPLRVETAIDYEFQRYTVANDHCYTPLTSPSQKLPPRPYYEQVNSPIETRSSEASIAPEVQTVLHPEEGTSGTTRKRLPSKVAPVPLPTSSVRRRKSTAHKEELSDAAELRSILEDTDSDYTEESSYPEDDDNDSDLDFSISGKQSKKRKSGSKNKSAQKSALKKDDSNENKDVKKKFVKSPKKPETKAITPVSTINKTTNPKTYGPKRDVAKIIDPPSVPVTALVPSVPVSVAPVSNIVAPVKKDKKPIKPAPHVEALFSDMTSLFSTPDIIKKVGSNRVNSLTTVSLSNPASGPSTSATVIQRGFVQLSPATAKGTQKLPAHISIQTHTSASEEHDKRLDLMESLTQQELDETDSKHSQNALQNTPLAEDIVKILENNLPPGGVPESVLPITDNSILAALGSNDDGLPEDLLQHVAELAENKELQEILDKQVLGVIGTDSIVNPAVSLPMPSTSAQVVPIITRQVQPVMQVHSATPLPIKPTNPESLPTMTVKEQLMPRKEAIQIRRSDGRVITLPPIEAPATRSAKRRAQTGTSSSSSAPATVTMVTTAAASALNINSPLVGHQSGVLSAKPIKHAVKATTTPLLYDDGSGSLLIDETRGKGSRSGASSRRTSESSSTSTSRGKRTSTVAVAAAAAAAAHDDEIESDESWNSEDDPDRLWCICKQPHNNRFMICCDECEDWFHGKCVNITKAMGQQMEEDGIEWTCPNCLRKKQDKQQPKMTEFLLASGGISSTEGSTAMTHTISPKVVTVTGCVVCGKPARASSVYCSDDCIRKHAGMAHSSSTVGVSSASTSTLAMAKTVAVSPGFASKDKSKEGHRLSQPPVLIKTSAKPGMIIVMERKTGRCLTGDSAPTAENLDAWLASNPTFERVPPGSTQEAIILAKRDEEVRKQRLAKELQKKAAMGAGQVLPQTGIKVQAQLKIGDQKKLTVVSPANQQRQQQAHTKPVVKVIQRTSVTVPISKGIPTTVTYTPKVSVNTPKVSASTPKAVIPSASTTPTTSTSTVSKPQKKTTPETKPMTPPATAGENTRVTVKKTLMKHLVQRTLELSNKDAPRLSEQEIDQFAEEIEEEMFTLFNKDTGMKYRAKYRSLVFNIKDRKNLSLFKKICEKRIGAKQLVHMTADELASQELAQWREKENKHQLEMIKKSELDLLACAKNYVLKTHKGEEVIEGKRVDRVQLDPTTSVEDVVTVLNNSTVSSTSEVDSTLSPSKDGSYRPKDYEFNNYGKYSSGLYGSGSITSSSTVTGSTAVPAATLPASSTAASTSTKKKESRRSRSRSNSRDRRRGRSRSRSKHKRRRSKSHDRHASRERDRDRGRERDRSRHHEHKSDHKSDYKKHDSKETRDKEKATVDKTKDKKIAVSVISEKDKSEAVGKLIDDKKISKKSDNDSHELESFNLIDQILASAGTSDGKLSESTELSANINPEESNPSPVASTEQDQEPTSTVTIPTPPHSTNFESESPTPDFTSNIPGDVSEEVRKKALFVHWTGNVHMIDVASIEMSMRSVSGDIEDVAKDFAEDLDICGTIKPEIVWDYIGQIRKSPNKEVCLVRLHSNESSAYYTLYSHLYSRKRYSVIKSPSPLIKDFYIFPLPAEQMVPMILKPLRGVGIIEGNKKPDLLLGIIVKIRGKRSGSSSTTTGAAPAKTPRRQSKQSTTTSSSSAVSPSFALMQQVITKYATVNKKAATKPDVEVTKTPPSSQSPVQSTANVPSVSSMKKSAPETSADAKKRRSESESPEQIDMDIIKGPVAVKAQQTIESPVAVIIDDDDEEPYSPGCISDDSDNFADVTAIVETKQKQISVPDNESERIRLEMEEINRKIAEEKNKIVGIISKAELKEDEIKSTLPPSLITDISIPSNLSEILASIKATPSTSEASSKIVSEKETEKKGNVEDEDEYIPSAPSFYSNYKTSYGYGNVPTPQGSMGSVGTKPVQITKAPTEGASKLSKLSDEELLSMVPDDSYLQPPVRTVDPVPPPKKAKWDSNEPPPPGMEDAMDGD
ncbi:death-inducer obliterator 1-like [Topomyia yanbarensis]|uniref:death-inducer obliterator 1-like n=1 Tax=Topomyia yanbarensis TaxID=2498891 RepID=UPI00273B5103|nr:death-inducer obliterator 1-like [Topomyia yanbarensis]